MNAAIEYDETEVADGVSIKRWTRGVPIGDEALRQLENVARLPIVFHHIAAMPDVHLGIGATVGAVIRPSRRSSRPRSGSTSAAG